MEWQSISQNDKELYVYEIRVKSIYGILDQLMAYIEWTKEYQTGVYDIDQQHQRLFALVNELHDYATKSMEFVPVKAAIDAVADYVEYHFTNEEQMLEIIGYKELEAHILEHKALEQKVKFYRNSFVQDPTSFEMVDFLGFLNSWLKEHIMRSDMDYVPSVVNSHKLRSS